MRLIKGTFCEECRSEWLGGKLVIEIEIDSPTGRENEDSSIEICEPCLRKALELIERGKV